MLIDSLFEAVFHHLLNSSLNEAQSDLLLTSDKKRKFTSISILHKSETFLEIFCGNKTLKKIFEMTDPLNKSNAYSFLSFTLIGWFSALFFIKMD